MKTAAAVALLAVFGFAAASKARSRDEFAEYLGPPLVGRLAELTVAAVLVAEGMAFIICALAVALKAPFTTLCGICTTAFVISVTAGYGGLLATGSAPACHCFSQRRDPKETPTDVVAPAIVALRNAAIVGLGLAVWGPPIPVTLSALGLPALLTAVALVASIRRERGQLGQLDNAKVRALTPQIGRLQAHTWWLDGFPKPD